MYAKIQEQIQPCCDKGQEKFYREELCNCKSIISGATGATSVWANKQLWETKDLSRGLEKSMHVIHYRAYHTCTITQIAILLQ